MNSAACPLSPCVCERLNIDSVIQKYLTGHAEQGEKEWLLSELCKFYNELLVFIKEHKTRGVVDDAVHGL